MSGSLVLTSASAGGDDHSDKGTTIRLKAKSVDEAQVDTGPAGPSLGDQVVFTDDLYLRKQKVGTVDGLCTVTRLAEPTTIVCLVNATVDGAGQISHQGTVYLTAAGELPSRFVLPIVGGTGDFVGAEGQTKLMPRNETTVRLKVMLED